MRLILQKFKGNKIGLQVCPRRSFMKMRKRGEEKPELCGTTEFSQILSDEIPSITTHIVQSLSNLEIKREKSLTLPGGTDVYARGEQLLDYRAGQRVEFLNRYFLLLNLSYLLTSVIWWLSSLIVKALWFENLRRQVRKFLSVAKTTGTWNEHRIALTWCVIEIQKEILG